MLYGEPVKRHIRQLLKDSKAVAGSPEAEEEDMIAFTRAISWAMRVSSGREAVQLLLRSHRVFQDLMLGELLADDPQQFSTFLVVRPWVAMLPEWEFRCFVSGHRLTTCTQYYPDCFVSQISSQRDAIKARITTFWEQRVRHLIPEHVPDYTMDLVLSPDLEQVLIVELNNPPPVAGTSLFSWDCAADRTLISSSPELHFRCLSSVPPDVKSRIHPPLKDLLLHLRGQHDPHAGPWDISCDHCHQPLSTDSWHFCVDCGDFELCQPCFQQHATTHQHSNWALAAYHPANSSSSSTSSSSSDSCFIL
ncbi:MAG: hypothetical protein Q8P67_13525 [archaeon]|nr:hypothetical protein [archaeon]